jgi:hypothetical protein
MNMTWSLAHGSLGSCPEGSLRRAHFTPLRHAVACRSRSHASMCQIWWDLTLPCSITDRHSHIVTTKHCKAFTCTSHAQRPKVRNPFNAQIGSGIVIDQTRLQSSAAPLTNKGTWFLDQPQAFFGDRLSSQHVVHFIEAPMRANTMNLTVDHQSTKIGSFMQTVGEDKTTCK